MASRTELAEPIVAKKERPSARVPVHCTRTCRRRLPRRRNGSADKARLREPHRKWQTTARMHISTVVSECSSLANRAAWTCARTQFPTNSSTHRDPRVICVPYQTFYLLLAFVIFCRRRRRSAYSQSAAHLCAALFPFVHNVRLHIPPTNSIKTEFQAD